MRCRRPEIGPAAPCLRWAARPRAGVFDVDCFESLPPRRERRHAQGMRAPAPARMRRPGASGFESREPRSPLLGTPRAPTHERKAGLLQGRACRPRHPRAHVAQSARTSPLMLARPPFSAARSSGRLSPGPSGLCAHRPACAREPMVSSRRCGHSRQARTGSNAHQQVVVCTQCGKALFSVYPGEVDLQVALQTPWLRGIAEQRAHSAPPPTAGGAAQRSEAAAARPGASGERDPPAAGGEAATNRPAAAATVTVVVTAAASSDPAAATAGSTEPLGP